MLRIVAANDSVRQLQHLQLLVIDRKLFMLARGRDPQSEALLFERLKGFTHVGEWLHTFQEVLFVALVLLSQDLLHSFARQLWQKSSEHLLAVHSRIRL